MTAATDRQFRGTGAPSRFRAPQSRGARRTMRKARATLCALLFVAPAASAQSIIFPKIFDQHVPHIATKPAISLGVYGVARWAKASPGLATGIALIGPEVFSVIRTRINYPGHLPWQDPAAIGDIAADTWAASLSLIMVRMHGWKRLAAMALWAIVEFPVGLHKMARP